MQCSFEETIDLPSGGYQHSKCINRAEILFINDPCYGLCFACAYRKLQAENKKLREILVREVDDGRAEVDDIGIDAWLEQALKGD